MQLKSHHVFKLELSEAAILATKPTRILPYRSQVTHLWVFSIMKGTEYMTSHMISHFKLLSVIPSPQNKQENLSLLVSFCWGIRHSGRFSTKSVSLLLWSWYGNESGLLIIGRSSTFPIIFSVSGSSDSQRELIDPLIPILMTWMHRSQVTKWFLGQLQRWVEFHHYWRRKWQALLQDLVGLEFLIVFRCM